MIDPRNITDFNRSEKELQEFLLFGIMVHGKKSSIQAVKLEQFLIYLAHVTGQELPFEMIDVALNTEDDRTGANLLFTSLQKFKIGQYNRLFRAIGDLIRLPSLKVVTLEQLENCFAIGQKTARFFLVHSRPNQQLAILDTHILKLLRSKGIENVPDRTPTGKKQYEHFEKIFLTMVETSGQSVAEYDLTAWKEATTNVTI